MFDKLYAYLIGAALAIGAGWFYGHLQYESGYAAANTKQVEAIAAYQKIVVQKDQEHLQEMAKTASEHAAAIAKAEADKPQAQEKIRVITKTIERPAVCNLHDSELQLINKAIHTANGQP